MTADDISRNSTAVTSNLVRTSEEINFRQSLRKLARNQIVRPGAWIEKSALIAENAAELSAALSKVGLKKCEIMDGLMAKSSSRRKTKEKYSEVMTADSLELNQKVTALELLQKYDISNKSVLIETAFKKYAEIVPQASNPDGSSISEQQISEKQVWYHFKNCHG